MLYLILQSSNVLIVLVVYSLHYCLCCKSMKSKKREREGCDLKGGARGDVAARQGHCAASRRLRCAVPNGKQGGRSCVVPMAAVTTTFAAAIASVAKATSIFCSRKGASIVAQTEAVHEIQRLC